MQNDKKIFRKEKGKCMVSNQPDEINKGDCLLKQQRGGSLSSHSLQDHPMSSMINRICCDAILR